MAAFFVPNPEIPGAMGVVVELKKNNRYFFSTGDLSGCGVAMLMKGDYAYFIHAGADGGGSVAEIETDEQRKMRRELINRDIFRMAQLLDEQPHDFVRGISQSNLRDLLIERNFEGIVLTCVDEETKKKKSSEKITMLDYDTSTYYHNMIGVANESGICVGVRTTTKAEVIDSEQYKYIRK